MEHSWFNDIFMGFFGASLTMESMVFPSFQKELILIEWARKFNIPLVPKWMIRKKPTPCFYEVSELYLLQFIC